MSNIPFVEVRIPTLPMGKIVNEQGMPTDDELQFRQSLITLLNKLIGTQGVVPPSQTTADITLIATNQQITPLANGAYNSTYTMLPGALLYNTSTGKLVVNVPVAGVPTIKEVITT